MAKGKNLKFDVLIDFDECDSKNAKLGYKGGRGLHHVTHFSILEPPLYLRKD